MLYFAYGYHLNKKQMKALCPDSLPKFSAVLPNYQLVFYGWSRKWRGGQASLKKVPVGKVKGAIYEVNDNCLGRLDSFEGLDYKRLPVIVFDEDGTSHEAVTYIAKKPMEETKPGKEYLDAILAGYKEWQIE